MEPTVHVGDRVVVSKAAYGLRLPLTDAWLVSFAMPARGDVVVLEPPEPTDEVAAVLLKRVVALPGEVVEVRDGHVHIDDRVVDEKWASLAMGPGPAFGPVRVPRQSVLVLGDNRGNSRDGRAFGFVSLDHVLGRATHVVARDGKLSWLPLRSQ